MSNAGASINFDAQAIHDAEEAEYHREEKERENELRAALLDAFDDDMSDEDSDVSHDQGPSLVSQEAAQNLQTNNAVDAVYENDPEQTITNEVLGSGQVTTGTHHKVQTTVPYSDPTTTPYTDHAAILYTGHTVTSYMGHMADPYSNPNAAYAVHPTTPYTGHINTQHFNEQITSTPLNNLVAPPLSTPSSERCCHENTEHIQQDNSSTHDAHYCNYTDYPAEPYYGNTGHVQAQPELFERGEIEGANDEDAGYMDGRNFHAIMDRHPAKQDPYTTDYLGNYAYHPLSKHLQESKMYSQNEPFVQTKHHDVMTASQDAEKNFPYPAAPNQELDVYKVTYKGVRTSARPAAVAARDKTESLGQATSPRPANTETRYDDLQKEFLNTGSNHQMEQMQILYAARGRKVEELTEQLKALKEDSDREIRILKHKLTIAEGERDGISTSLDQCQQLLRESRERETKLEGQVTALESQIDALNKAKQQLISNLQSHEATIESLNAQLVNLEASESLSRTRQQHQAIVSGIKEKHETEIYLLKEKLDQCQRTAENKDVEIDNLKKQVSSLLKSSEDIQINRADTVNQLTRSLEESQRQCQQLLEAGHGQELSKLKLQLQEVIASKSITEDMNNALQDEVRELKEQVMMYESISQFGIFSNTTTASNVTKLAAGFDDSYAQLGIKSTENRNQAAQWQTPQSDRSETSRLSNEDTIQALKAELERCLLMYKRKREQVTELQEKLKSTLNKLEDYKMKLAKVEQELKENQEKIKAFEDKMGDCITASNPREALANKELENITREKDRLVAEVEELKGRLQETASNEEKALELNQELRAEMSQMIQEFDEDKRQALEKCQEAVLQHHEEVCKKQEQELRNQLNEEKTQLEKHWQAKYEEAINQHRAVQKELDEVKNLYIAVCKEKDGLDDELRIKYDNKLQNHVDNLKLQFEEEKKEELKTILEAKKEQWKKEEEDFLTKKLETEICSRKAQWFEEHQKMRDDAIERALKVNNLEWQQKWDSELYKTVEEQLNKVQEKWNTKTEAEFQKRLQQELSAAKQMWQDTELVKAKEIWRNTELQMALGKAKDEALKEAENKAKEEHQKAVSEAVEHARKQWESDHVSFDRLHELEEKCESLKLELDQLQQEKSATEQELLKNRAVWQQEKEELIKKKDAEKREAILEIQQQTEKEYREFLSEHQDTLNKALSSAREQYKHEKDALRKQFLAELDAIKQGQSPSINVEESERDKLFIAVTTEHKKLHDQLEARLNDETAQREKLREQWEARLNEETAEHEKSRDMWEARIAAIMAEHENEKHQLLVLHRENMAKALDEVRSHWQKKLESILQQSDRAALLEQVKHWEEERAHYLAIIEEREQLLQSADQHMESELARLHEQLKKQLQEGNLLPNNNSREEASKFQFDGQTDVSHRFHGSMPVLEESLHDHVNRDLKEEMKKIQEIHGKELKTLEDELEAKHKQEVQHKLEKMASVHEEEKKRLREDMEKRLDECTASSQAEIEKLLTKLEDTRKQLKDLYGKYTKDTKNMAKKIELQSQELKNATRLIEEGELERRSLEKHKETLQAKVESLSKELEKAEKLRQEVVSSLKQSEKEHEEIIKSYKTRCLQMAEKIQHIESQLKMVKAEAHQKLVNMQQSMEREHSVAIDNLKLKLVEINEKYNEDIKHLQKQHECERERLIQELSQKDSISMYDMRDQYLEAVEKIREDVLKHLSQSNEQAAITLQLQVMKERQHTARRLRRYYMKCLAHMLDKDCDPITKEHKLSAMERYLDSLPERDGSRSTTPSVPSSDLASKPSTPVNLTQTLSDQSRSSELASSSNELPHNLRKTPNRLSQSGCPSAFLSSSQPSSADSGRDSWVTLRSQTNQLSSMTYPVPVLKNSSPSNVSSGPPPFATSQWPESKKQNRRNSLERQEKLLPSQFSYTFDQGLSVSTPNLTPRQVGFSEAMDEMKVIDIQERMTPTSVMSKYLTDTELHSTYNTGDELEKFISREQSPMDDILNKYAIGPLPPRHMPTDNADLPGSAQSTPGRNLKMSYTAPRPISHARSTEFLHRDTHMTLPATESSVTAGYKYTSLCGILSSRGQSRSSSQLHTLHTETNRLCMNDAAVGHHGTPPERLPGSKQQGTPPRPHFVPRLQLKSLDVDLNQVENLQSVTPLADQEVARLNRDRSWKES